MRNPLDPNEREFAVKGHVPPRAIPPRLERDPCERTDFKDPEPHGATSPWEWKPQPFPANLEATPDNLADWRLIQAGLRPWPTKSRSRRVRAMLFLKKLCSSLGRAAAVFALCFAATTLALRLAPLQAPAPSAASPAIGLVGMPGASECSKVRP